MQAANPELAFEVANSTDFNIEGSVSPMKPLDTWGNHTISTSKRGVDVLNNPYLNKGQAFTSEERASLQLCGYLPNNVSTLEEQIEMVQSLFDARDAGISQYRFAMSIASENLTLFHAWIKKYFERVAPAIYTPAVGDACLKYGENTQPLNGLYFTPEFKGLFDKIISSWDEKDVEVVVVTDGGRILGLGDLGSNGMPIPVGKLALYTALAGIRPEKTLPIMLDVGTNNVALRESGSYQGWSNSRLGGREYYELVDELILSIKTKWPNCLIQFEDFSSSQAWILLDAYIGKTCCFNDDIQGTGAVVTAGILNALRIVGSTQKKSLQELLRSGKYIIVGGGSAGYGVCLAIWNMILSECELISEEQASNNLFVMDTKGVLPIERAIGDKKPLRFIAKDFSNKEQSMGVTKDDKLIDVIRKVKPCGIIGLTGTPGMFSEEIVREMSKINEEPIIFPLSNPTDKAECTFNQALEWSAGKCLFGSGSPFNPVSYDGALRQSSQTNNMYIFPGVGLAAVLSRSKGITNKMFAIASKVLAYSISDAQLCATRCLFPGLNKVRDISCSIALEVMREMNAAGLSQLSMDEQNKLSLKYVRERMYTPLYPKISPRL
ncbi:NAD-dependent malic enzyme [Perkinsela sp. CCAP 1560/4]|nr:NAD-dependent malic enzyme [Perkinsela sp. CCAP 1560/4]|eukprot:KNH06268.1 NAD-dependent malic enzyme [Perkinsela sp. CCAP 1560/4]